MFNVKQSQSSILASVGDSIASGKHCRQYCCSTYTPISRKTRAESGFLGKFLLVIWACCRVVDCLLGGSSCRVADFEFSGEGQRPHSFFFCGQAVDNTKA